jgi:hypothetical protein
VNGGPGITRAQAKNNFDGSLRGENENEKTWKSGLEVSALGLGSVEGYDGSGTLLDCDMNSIHPGLYSGTMWGIIFGPFFAILVIEFSCSS